MGTVKTKGIVIAENNTSDFDKMLTMLTPGLGKISCAAKGARRPKSTLMAGSQFLCFGDYILYKGHDAYNINTCETIEVFYNIRTDLDKLQQASEVTKMIREVTTENQNSYRILQLYLNTLYTISETDKNYQMVFSIFRLRLLSLLGFAPTVKHCTNCKTTEGINYFSIKQNGLLCTNCGKLDSGAIKICDSTRLAIQYSILANAKKLYSINISEEGNNELSLIAKLYVKDKLQDI